MEFTIYVVVASAKITEKKCCFPNFVTIYFPKIKK